MNSHPGSTPLVLTVEDDAETRAALASAIELKGFQPLAVESAEEAIAALERSPVEPALALCDLKLPGMSGISLLSKLKPKYPAMPIVLVTGYGSMETAIEALRLGATDYLAKPLSSADIDRALAYARRSLTQIAGVPEGISEPLPSGFTDVIAHSPEMAEALKQVARAATGKGCVLLIGEPGTGRALLAREIHRRSNRASGPFVALDCSSLTDTGRFDDAKGGTLFLSDISDLSPTLQAKLLPYLKTPAIERPGDPKTDVRVIAATCKDFDSFLASGRFRDDVVYRLGVTKIQIPSLRKRPADIPALWKRFLGRVAQREGLAPPDTTPEVLSALLAYDWPGNVRELESVAEHVVSVGRGEKVSRELLPPRVAGATGAGGDLRIPGATLAEIERVAILRTFAACGGSSHKTAAMLNVSVRKIQYRLKEYRAQGLLPNAPRPGYVGPVKSSRVS
jgi:DNA-binding NtrC family response regulator